jgi:primosomal protein N' (replication factor Y)
MSDQPSERPKEWPAEQSAKRLWKIAVDAPVDTLFTYSSSLPLQIGQSVRVPLGRRTAVGVVWSETLESPGANKIKSVIDVDEERPLLSTAQLQWLEWLAKYYVHPLGQVAETSFPPLKKKGRGSRKKSVVQTRELKSPPILTAEQSKVVHDVAAQLGVFRPHLIFGVTGSGKTEIYLQVLERVLARGQQGLVIVPEISLTPQLIQRFIERFGDRVAVFHSHLTAREKTEQWWAMMSGEKQFLVGARSALFCPLEKLGVIIVDEEHEPSFKQEEKLKYHARDSAIMKASFENIPILLGSATPSLESWRNAETGKFQLHRLANRVSNTAMPAVQIVDLREVEKRDDGYSWLSPQLEQSMRSHLARQGQVALFLNRRGVAPSLLCATCGSSIMCPNCSVALTLHGRSHLVCHYCDFHQHLPDRCPTCAVGVLKPMGVGTERIEADLAKLFPDSKTIRADRDEIQNRQAMEALIEELESGSAQIVIGTQMIAKGLDFPKLSLVGVLLADIGFHLPDFRATERSFQLLTQVAGRAGRRLTQGEVIIQTFNPEHPSIQYSVKHDCLSNSGFR